MKAGLTPTVLAVAAALAGCASLGQTSYDLGTGDANYDALKSATQACGAQSGTVHLKSGYDGRDLAGYECVLGKAR